MNAKSIPSAEDCKAAWDEAQTWAASVGYKEEDVKHFIQDYRKKNVSRHEIRHDRGSP